MTQKDYLHYLYKTLDDLKKARIWLDRSYQKCTAIGTKSDYTENEFDQFENLTSRFARASDILIQKVYRSIDKVEFEDSGTLIDILNRAHKRNLFESIEDIRHLRELRNDIAHEYKALLLPPIFESVLGQTPLLFTYIDRALDYCERY